MEPTLYDGDRLLVRYAPKPRPGRLAVVRLPDGPHGTRPLAVKRLSHPVPDAASGEPDGWWVRRDNPSVGVDSRQVGVIPAPDVLAVVLLRLPRGTAFRLGPHQGTKRRSRRRG